QGVPCANLRKGYDFQRRIGPTENLIFMISKLLNRLSSLHHNFEWSRLNSDRKNTYKWIVGFIFLLLWVLIYQIEVVSVGFGEVTPSGQIKKIQHLEGGIISEVFVSEGQKVRAGQSLLKLEGISESADMKELDAYIASLNLDILRLEAETSGAQAMKIPASLEQRYPGLVKEARALFQSRRDRYLGMIDALKLQREQVKISEDLLKSEVQSRLMHLSVLREENQLKGRIQDYQQEVSTQLSRAKKELAEKEQRFVKYSDSVSRSLILAPVDGEVKVIYFKTKGGVVPPGGVMFLFEKLVMLGSDKRQFCGSHRLMHTVLGVSGDL
ncbi:MAG: hypothetical protein RL132_1419, partial [Pseudomonadota bacterium]